MTMSFILSKFTTSINRTRITLMHDLAAVYKPAVTRQKDRLIEYIKEKSEITSNSEVARKLRRLKGFYALEMAPPSSQGEMKTLIADTELAQQFIKDGCFKFLTVKQAWLLFLVCLEIVLWFFIGETIGKFHIVGYKV